jgi:pilus assembly protein Flp/PilA
MPLVHRTPAPERERGASAVEYALVLVGIAALIVIAVVGLGGKTNAMFDDTCTEIDGQAAATCQT